MDWQTYMTGYDLSDLDKLTTGYSLSDLDKLMTGYIQLIRP